MNLLEIRKECAYSAQDPPVVSWPVRGGALMVDRVTGIYLSGWNSRKLPDEWAANQEKGEGPTKVSVLRSLNELSEK